MTAPTTADTMRAAAESMGMHLSQQQIDDSTAMIVGIKDQVMASGVPEPEAEMLASGFALGYRWAEQTVDTETAPLHLGDRVVLPDGTEGVIGAVGQPGEWSP